MAKQKKPDVSPDLLRLMHPDIPFDEGSLAEPAAKTSGNDDYKAQMAELQASVKQLADQNSSLQRTNMALMAQPMQQVMPTYGPTEVDLNNLPDPVVNPKEYAAAIVQRGDAVLRTRQQQANWEANQAAQLDQRTQAIWDQFTKEHPALADKSDLVEAAAGKAVAKARQMGMDTNRYMFSATNQFFNDTIGILNGWGIKDEAADDADDDSAAKPSGRTAGIPGGLDSGGRLSAGKDPDETRIPTLMEEVRGWKMKTGFM